MKTIEEVRKICEELMLSRGYHVDFPIEVNKRLKTTFGRVTVDYSLNQVDKMEFAAVLLDSDNDAEIIETIKHETAHVLAFYYDFEKHGHDALWKNIYFELGGNGEVYGNMSEIVGEKGFKYAVYCSGCGTFLRGFTRSCKTVQHPNMFVSKCCKKPLKIVQNW